MSPYLRNDEKILLRSPGLSIFAVIFGQLTGIMILRR